VVVDETGVDQTERAVPDRDVPHPHREGQPVLVHRQHGEEHEKWKCASMYPPENLTNAIDTVITLNAARTVRVRRPSRGQFASATVPTTAPIMPPSIHVGVAGSPRP